MRMESKRKPSFANILLAPSVQARKSGSFGQMARAVMLGALHARRYASARVVLPATGMSVPRRLRASNFCAVHAMTGCARSMASNTSFEADGFAAAQFQR